MSSDRDLPRVAASCPRVSGRVSADTSAAADASSPPSSGRAGRQPERRQERPVRPTDGLLRDRLELPGNDRLGHARPRHRRTGGLRRSSTPRASTRSRARSARTNRSPGACLWHDGIDLVVQVADARNLRRALMLTWQLARMDHRMVLVLNMVDEARTHGVDVDAAGLQAALGIPVIETVATEGRGLPAVARRAAAGGRARDRPGLGRGVLGPRRGRAVPPRPAPPVSRPAGAHRARGPRTADRRADPAAGALPELSHRGRVRRADAGQALRGRAVRPLRHTRVRTIWPTGSSRSRSCATSSSATTAS